MPVQRRWASLESVLVDTDEPQLLAMRAGKSRLIALAIPDEDPHIAKFIATTVSQRDWDSYDHGSVDLRYLFTFPLNRTRYTFNLRDAKKNKVNMYRYDEEIPDRFLPHTRFFSENHTEEFGGDEPRANVETLLVDGAWDMPEFGKFYQRYSDIYSFIVALINWTDPNVNENRKKEVEKAFATKPFKGGSSYRHFYRDLVENLGKGERLGLQEIQYASPGHVDVKGREDAFEDIQGVIRWYVDHRPTIHEKSTALQKFLSKGGFARMSGERFLPNDPQAGFILEQARALNAAMRGPNFESIKALSKDNSLVAAKIVLSFYRRLDDAAEFFSQGRVNFSD